MIKNRRSRVIEGDAETLGRFARRRVKRRHRLTWRRAVALLVLALVPAGIVLGVARSANADGDDNKMNLSFYKVASAMTNYFSSSQQPGSTMSKDWTKAIADPGTAGSMLGYPDPSLLKNPSGWLQAKASGSSDAIGYDTLVVKDSKGNAASSDKQGMSDYAYFGACLKGLGVDTTSTGLSLNFSRWIMGVIILGLYMVAGAVDWVFQGVLTVLATINPFKLFWSGVHAVSPRFADGMTGRSHDLGPMQSLGDFVSGWYVTIHNLSWNALMPVFLGVLAVSLVLFKNMNKGSALKKFAIRLVFIGFGLPLIGAMYTQVIGSMSCATDDATSTAKHQTCTGDAGATRVVMSTYVDFDKWMTTSRLRIPDGADITWDVDNHEPSGKSEANVRNTALAINNQSYGFNLHPIIGNANQTDKFEEAAMSPNAQKQETGLGSGTYFATTGMLKSYMAGDKITGASFETQSKGGLSNYAQSHPKAGDKIKPWFDNYDDSDIGDRQYDSSDKSIGKNALITVKPGTGLRGKSAHEDGQHWWTLTSNTQECRNNGIRVINGSMSPRDCNLSPLAAYNYLNTDFEPTSLTMYSSSNAMSEATREMHNSVNQVGTGAMSFLYWLDAAVLLLSFVVIGISYAMALLLGNIKRSLQVITAVPFATLGSVAAIAKVIIYSIALILEVVLTIFAYRMVQEFLLALPQLIEKPLAKTFLSNKKSNGFVSFLFAGTGMPFVICLISIVLTIGFLVMALRFRKVMVKAMEETVTKLIEKFTDSTVGTPGGMPGKLAPALAGGAAAGAGSAIGNKAMSKLGKGPDATDKGKGGKPGGIESGDATGTVDGKDGDEKSAAPDGANGADGEITTDGHMELEGGQSGSGGDDGTGSGLTPGGGMGSSADDQALGKTVEERGLSPDGKGYGGSGDAMDTVAGSMADSSQQYKESDQKRVSAGKDAAVAAGLGAVAAARAAGGDEAGAAKTGAKAVSKAQDAQNKGKQARQQSKNAGKSSLDGGKRPAPAKRSQNGSGKPAPASQSNSGTPIKPKGPKPAQNGSKTSQKPVKPTVPKKDAPTAKKQPKPIVPPRKKPPIPKK